MAADWKSQVAISAGHDQTIRCPSAWVSVFSHGCKLERMAYNDLERFADGKIRVHLDSKKSTQLRFAKNKLSLSQLFVYK